MDSESEWEKEKLEQNKFILSQADADEKIYPTRNDIKKVLDN